LSSNLSEFLRKIDEMKKKYHSKMLTADAELSLIMRGFETYDLFRDSAYLLVPEYSYAGLSIALLLGFDLSEIEPLNLDFTYRMPTEEEWYRGVSIVFERIIPLYATLLSVFIKENIEPLYASLLAGTRISKGVYDESYYGYSYYDPRAVSEFLRNTIQLFFKKHPNLVERRENIEAMTKTLNINPNLAKAIHDKISIVISTHTECFTLGYSLLGKARLCQSRTASPTTGIVPMIDMNGNYYEIPATNLAQVLWGFTLGLTPLGYGILAPREDIFAKPSPMIAKAIEKKTRDVVGRYMLTPLALSNYTSPEESVDYRKSERIEIWGELMGTRSAVENIVDSLLRREMPELDPMTRRSYITASLQLLGAVSKKHEWGYRVYRELTEDELGRWWIDLWERKGLKRDILEKIYEIIKPYIEMYKNKKKSFDRQIKRRILLQ
jgi:hypothetical protein